MGPSSRFTHVIVILMFETGYMQVLYLGRAPRTKDTLPDFREKMSGHPTLTSISRVDG